jgi:carotenoid cleavage dioxygenase
LCPLAGEDDGFLLVYVYSAEEDISYLHIYDAATMDPTPLAAVRLPQRVPYGFHGTWVTAKQLREQVLV